MKRGYDGWAEPVVEPFTKEQRQRLEALTLARRMLGSVSSTTHLDWWIQAADYIVTGRRA